MGSATKVELTTVADCQSSLHRLVTSIDCKSLHRGLTDIIAPLTRVAFAYNGPKGMELAHNL